MLLIPKKEAPKDVAYFKGQLTGNAWLNRAGQLAAAKKRVLGDPTLTAKETVVKIKPISHQLLQANKPLRQIPSVEDGGGKDNEDGSSDLITTRLEKWLQRLAKDQATKR